MRTFLGLLIPHEAMAMATPSTSDVGQADKEEEKIIECVALFYEKGKTKLEYVRKEKFRASIPVSITSLTKLKNLVRYVCIVFFTKILFTDSLSLG